VDQKPESFQNQPLSDLERRRIESEIARNEAENRKLIAESEDLERRKKWHIIGPLIKWVLGGVIMAGLLANWVISYYEPMRQTKQINAELNNAKLATENWTQMKINEQQRQENEKQKKINEEQRQENNRITKGMSELKVRFDSLSKETKLTAQERSKLLVQANALNEDIVQLRLKTIYFDSTSFELRSDAKASLDENVRTLQEFPDIKIRIEAYGDGFFWNTTLEHRQHPGFTYQIFFDRDKALGEKRAKKVMDYLTLQGISASRITVISNAGEFQPTRRSCRFVVIKQ
jgi:outer membrane protein OmpA-like peptidoglycan-associated protein